MLAAYGFSFAKALTALSEAKLLCLPFQVKPGERQPSDKEVATAVLYAVGLMRDACLFCDMTAPLPELKRLADLVSPQGAIPFPERSGIAQAIVHLNSRIQDELRAAYFVRVDQVRLYEQRHLFGSAVAKKFANASEDIDNSGKCLALNQSTACVFHLMRAMEIAVRQLSKRLKVTITPQTTWRQMTGQMDDKIKKMPETTSRLKRKKNDWESARANLHHVGSVWRNNTIHPATSYTPSQARDIFNAVRVFMTALADL